MSKKSNSTQKLKELQKENQDSTGGGYMGGIQLIGERFGLDICSMVEEALKEAKAKHLP